MALTTCPECGKELSDQADECPHCGFAIRRLRVEATVKRYKRHHAVWLVLFVVGAILTIRGISNHFEPLEMTFGFLLGTASFLAILFSAIGAWWKHA